MTRLDPCKYKPIYRAKADDGHIIFNVIQPYGINKFQPLSEGETWKREWEASPRLGGMQNIDLNCYVQNLVGVRWKRGPFYDGKCGIGVKTLVKTSEKLAEASENSGEAYVTCENDDEKSPSKIGPYFCMKRPCGNMWNTRNPDLPKDLRYGWNNISHQHNGIYRIDPLYPDIFQRKIAFHPSQTKAFDYDAILSRFKHEMSRIVAGHPDERPLSLSILSTPNLDKTMRYLGARLVRSLIVGKPFGTN